jgi:hypothetical protein
MGHRKDSILAGVGLLMLAYQLTKLEELVQLRAELAEEPPTRLSYPDAIDVDSEAVCQSKTHLVDSPLQGNGLHSLLSRP